MITTEKFVAIADNDNKDYLFGQFIDALDFAVSMLDKGISVRIMKANGTKSSKNTQKR